MLSLAGYVPVYFALEQRGDVVVASFSVDRLSEEQNVEEMGREMFALVEKLGFSKVILALDQVEYITSAFLGKMISLHRKLHRQHGILAVCGIQQPVRDVLRSTRLLDYFRLADDVESAMQLMD